ncbi:hypothetical protein KC949_00010 [Candidatus Saccharibacteria bacterium]|nr:hypothetical protein [Candidatus Saccharibacteria bacterium]
MTQKRNINIKRVKTEVVKHTSAIASRAKPHIKSAAFKSAKPVLKTAKVTKIVVKKTHTKIAKRPHEKLTAKYSWYSKWHSKKYHSLIHTGVLSAYLLVVGVVVFGAYQAARAASDITTTWDFTNQSDYTAQDGVSVVANSAKFSPQNYLSDTNTRALYHFDETSGSTTADSSLNANTSTLSNTSFMFGRLNNALSFNGTDSRAATPSSSSLALSQSNTLESWTKLNHNFNSNSDAQRRPILDRGDYQLYYDNETGKVVYELANQNANTWTLSAGGSSSPNGGWDDNGKRGVMSQVKMGSDIYIGTGIDVGDAEVWKWNGTDWTQIGGGYPTLNNGWDANTYEVVNTLATDGTNIYAGLGKSYGDAEVWKWNGSTWSKIGGDLLNGSWNPVGTTNVNVLHFFKGTLYAGVRGSTNYGQLWKWDGSTWTLVAGNTVPGTIPAGYENVYSIDDDGTNLYMGMGLNAGDGDVWRWNGASTWTQIGGDGLNSGWAASKYEMVYAIKYANGKLYAGTGNSSGDAEVWSWNGTAWTKIGGAGLNGWPATLEAIYSLESDGTNIYVGTGYNNGKGKIYKWNGSTWTQIGGTGGSNDYPVGYGDIVYSLLFADSKLYTGLYDANGFGTEYTYDGTNWTRIGGNYLNGSWGYTRFEEVQVMQAQGGYLYAGMGNTVGDAGVFRFDGSSWQLIGGFGYKNSWQADKYEGVYSMASYGGNLYVGLGTTQNTTNNDAEVWKWDGSTWSKIGGAGLNNSWPFIANRYGTVVSMAADSNYLYAGLGTGTRAGEVWQYNGTSWTQIAGGASIKGSWNNVAGSLETVRSMAILNGKLYAGLGDSLNDSLVWEYNGTSWTQIAGNGIRGSWASGLAATVESLTPYNGKLYAGLGTALGAANVWEYNGTNWVQIGGDGVNSSWPATSRNRVKTMAVYNGDLYAGLGSATGYGDVWRYHNGTWEQIGGNGMNGGWTSAIEEVAAFSPYKGRLYVGTGLTANADNRIWSWGDNLYLESAQSSFDTNWHHIAATYNGTTAKLFIDGVQNNQVNKSITIPDGNRPLLIGTSYGGREAGKAPGVFDGLLDEVRVSDVARSDLTTKPYYIGSRTLTLNTALPATHAWQWKTFSPIENTNGGSITYRFSVDDGTKWLYWNGTTWAESTDITHSNNTADINAHIATLPVTFSGLKWQAVLTGDGNQLVELTSVSVTSTADTTPPATPPSSIQMFKAKSGSSVANGSWTNGGSPDFTWTAGTDSESGVNSYCAYLGTDNTADVTTTKGLLGTSPVPTGNHCQFIVSGTELDLSQSGLLSTPLATSNSTYYLRIAAIDNAGNVGATTAQFSFKFDNTPPENPAFITAPSGFIKNKAATLTWLTSGPSAPSDAQSGLAGLQYKIGSGGTWYGASHDGTGSMSDLLPNSGNYTMIPSPDFDNLQEGINNIYFRTWDNAGNVSSTLATAVLKINTNGSPSEPQSLSVSPAVNTANSFGFSWSRPASFVGDAANLTYCYTVNTLPSEGTCNYTSAGATNLPSGPYATQHGVNVLYLVAKDESNNINYSSFASVAFSANTTAPGIPKNTDVVDVSVKSTNNWRLALTWEQPDDIGGGIASYKLERSLDGTTGWAFVGSSSSTTYIDANLSQQVYYYRVKACDNTNNCSADSTIVHGFPTGKFTSPALMVAEPAVSNVTTKKATLSWSTDRSSDSKIALGTTSGHYAASEVGNSNQVSSHVIDLDNLAAGTTYYYVAKWTDEDGNTGTSQEYTFTTAPAPTLKEVTTPRITLNGATVKFTSSNASKIDLLFGKSEAFGGIQSVNTALSESTYSIDLPGLDDGTKYFYKLISYDVDGNKYDGNIFSFSTPARPHISNLKFQPVIGEPTSTQEVSWDTNVPSTSVVSYGKVGSSFVDSSKSDLETHHVITIRGLEDDSQYNLIAQSRDGEGNLATSDTQSFHTALDTRPPIITEITVEPTIRGVGAEARGQIVVSWHTDEPATSQVAYGEGSNITVFPNKSAEDTGLSTEHVVIISDLPTSKVYSVQPISRDKTLNAGTGESQSAIIGRASDSILTVIFNTLKGIFGF